jgi:acetylornithine deacetylase/succinyl-diaminopimelate desuccinylase-like protein
VLLRSNLPVGIVTAIAGNSRFGVVVEGTAGHAGTVPMSFRHDAAAATAEVILAVERRCSRPGLLGTVGRLSVPAGAINVIPSRRELSIDIRADDDVVRHDAVKDVLAAMDESQNGVACGSTRRHSSMLVPCSVLRGYRT